MRMPDAESQQKTTEHHLTRNYYLTIIDQLMRLPKLLIIIFINLVAFITTLTAQNLIADPGFEHFSNLPCRQNGSFIQDLLANWIQPLPTSTDYWNSKSDISCELNPLSIKRFTRGGSGMTGVITAYHYNGLPFEYKEYIETKLAEPLKPKHLYYGEFYAYSKQTGENDALKSNNLGMAFSRSIIADFNDRSPDHLFLHSKIKANDIVEGNEWEKVSGCFIADKPYQYLLIGNFESIRSTLIKGDLRNTEDAYAYYFIDDVNLKELAYDLTSLKDSITLCGGQYYTELNAFIDGATKYTWEDGSHEPILNVAVKQSATISVNISFNECIYKHDFYVEYIPDIDLGSDTVICAGEELVITVGNSIKSFFWSDGTQDSVKHISSPGIYTATVLSDECEIRDSIEVSVIECPGSVLPNVFTPNGDDYNQDFVFENIENRTWSLQVFNRWGQQVFFSARYKNDWHGAHLANGVYYYKLQSKDLKKVVKGWVQIMR